MDFDFRFGGIRRLYGQAGLDSLASAHALVVGLGGVGSWTVEALVRSGLGEITLVDMDEVCESNINRQLQAMDGAVGKSKGDELAIRMKKINPNCKVNVIFDFFTSDTCEEIFNSEYNVVIDCIDSLKNKCLLLAESQKRNIPVVTTGGAGGKTDPFAIKKADLSKTHGDKMLAKLRKKLRQDFGFKTNGSNFGIDCVYSDEEAKYPTGDGCVTTEKIKMDATKLDCASGFGAVTHITGTFGFALAHLAIQKITTQK